MKKYFITLTMLSVLLSGCANNTSKESVGLLGGAAIGGLLGSQFGHGGGKIIGIALGSLIGAGIGSSVGHYMDEQDKQAAQIAAQSAFENGRSGEAVTWNNPDNGHHGSFIPQSAKKINGRICRKFVTTIVIDGKIEKANGIACRDASGNWEIRN